MKKNDYDWLDKGMHLSSTEAQTLEELILHDPNNLSTRLKLIGYYHFQIESALSATTHLLWLIDHQPQCHECYRLYIDKKYSSEQFAEFREHWLEQVALHPSNDRIIGHAASMISSRDREMGERLFVRAQKLNPRDPRWTRRLADMYRFLAVSGPHDCQEKNARLAVAETAKYLDLRDSLGEKVGLLISVIPLAIKWEDLNIARRWCGRLLKYGRRHEYPVWIETAFIYLARVELGEGNLKMSKVYLRRALVEIRNDPDYLGRNDRLMVLLDELYRVKEIPVVIEALELSMQKSSGADKKLIKLWLSQVEAGESPTFRF